MRAKLPISLGLALVVLLLYGRVLGHGFVNFDDDTYVTDNPRVLAGLDASGIAWAFTTTTESNWHPLTWLSHMADAQIWGARPGGHHATSVVLHAASSVLLFLALVALSDALWPAALAAALFAVHPLRVESVAWVAERKDVLSGLFFMLALLAYASYAKRPGGGRYALVLAAFAAGLLAKPMLVSLPLVLLALDAWPLARPRRLLEKVPLLALSAASCVVTLAVQRSAAASSLAAVPPAARLANAAIGYVWYLWKMLVPTGLGIFYPHPALLGRGLGPGRILAACAAALLLAALTWIALRRPYLRTGWLWYLAMLLPVIGLVQVGRQAVADRYAYLPLVGMHVALAWGAAELAERRPALRTAIAAGSLAALAVLAALSWVQVGRWKDGITLYRHTLRVTRDNYLVHNNLGVTLAERGELQAAEAEYREALRIQPDYPEAHNNLGTALKRQGKLAEAEQHFRATLRLRPDFEEAHANLGNVFEARGDLVQAREQYEAALRIRPESAGARVGLATVLARQGDLTRAEALLREAIAAGPARVEPHKNLGIVLVLGGKLPEAAAQYRRAIEIRPDDPDLHSDLGILLARMGRTAEAEGELRRALALRPDHRGARAALERLGAR